MNIIQRFLKTLNQSKVRTIGGIDLKPKKSIKLGYLRALKHGLFKKEHNEYSPNCHNNVNFQGYQSKGHGSTNFNSGQDQKLPTQRVPLLGPLQPDISLFRHHSSTQNSPFIAHFSPLLQIHDTQHSKHPHILP